MCEWGIRQGEDTVADAYKRAWRIYARYANPILAYGKKMGSNPHSLRWKDTKKHLFWGAFLYGGENGIRTHDTG